MAEKVLGVDACRFGWLGVTVERTGTSAYIGRSIVEVVSAAEATGGLAAVAVDIPIGLPDTGRRRADVLARQAVGPRWRSVFITPVRPALESSDHADAVRINRRLAREGVSAQAFGLRTKILEVDRWVRERTHRVVEVHPEVSFATMAGAPRLDSKTTWNGLEHRRRLLGDAGITIAPDLGPAGRLAGMDDVLDAAAAAWSARRVVGGEAFCLPSPPETFSDGLSCAIWV